MNFLHLKKMREAQLKNKIEEKRLSEFDLKNFTDKQLLTMGFPELKNLAVKNNCFNKTLKKIALAQHLIKMRGEL